MAWASLALVGFGLIPENSAAADGSRPNIVLILADDLGYADLGFQGARDIPTPHLDTLAASGVRCTSGYVSGPYCSPTRAGLLTGRYQQRFGHEFNPGERAGERSNEQFGLPLSQTTLADRLKAVGYTTGLVGKWHLGAAPAFHPQKRGFDEFFGFLGGGHKYFAEESTDIYRGTEVVKEPTYLTDAFGREAVSFIERHKGHPFFLELAFNAVHTPTDATGDRLARFSSITDTKRRTYAAMLVALDEAVGAVTDKLRASGLEENTLIVFFSDNGGPTMLGTTINGSRNDPLRGSKRTTLEGGVRVPFVWSWKGKLPAGRVYDKPLIQLDVLPTVLSAAGVTPGKDWGLDGVDLLPYLTGSNDKAPHDTLYWRLGGQAAIRRGDWKLVRYDAAVDTGERSGPRSAPKLSPFRLYNLAEDVGEARDLSAAHPERVKELLAAWETWSAGLAKPLWGPEATPAAPPRPNIVYLLADDLGWGDVGWHGGEIKTPNLDKLAAAGARLEQFYVQPVCSPTRAALLTGRYPMRHGLQVGVVRPWAQYGLPLAERTLPSALKEAGYETAIVGKWHLGHFKQDYLPTHRGFDHQYGHYNGALDYFTHIRDGGFDWHRDDHANHDEGYSTHLLAREAVRLVKDHDGSRPLFLYVPFNAVHAPHQVPESYKAAYAHLQEPRRTYAGMLTALDEAVGQIVAAIDKKGIRKETLILFSSDNGGPAPGEVTSNGPLRGAKATLYEGGVRVPAFATWEGRIEPGSVVNAPLHMVDWYPTLLTLAGGSLAQSLPPDGRDAWPAIAQGAPSPHDAILLNATPLAGAIRVGDWKLIVRAPGSNPRDDVHALEVDAKPEAHAAGAESVELFNIAEDPYERHNLAASQPARVAELRGRYDGFAREAVPPRSAPKAKGFKSPRVWGEAD